MPKYDPKMYDDCVQAFTNIQPVLIRRIFEINPAGLRRVFVESGNTAELAEMTEQDLRVFVRIGCLGLASGAGQSYLGELLSQELGND